MRLLPFRSLSTLLLVGAVLLFGAMWYYTDQLNEGAFVPDNTTPAANVRVLDVAEGRISLAPLTDAENGIWKNDGIFGLEWEGGYARVGRIVDLHPDSVRRELIVIDEAPRVNTDARLDTFAYRGDPFAALGLAFEDVTIDGPAGEGPAWLIPGSGSTWAVFIHGKGASREEAYRSLLSLKELSLPILLVTYRNDPEFSRIDDGRYAYGETEWEDVAAAMDYARDRGAERFVLIGNSMGGSITLAVLQHPEYATLVDAVVLDSPVLDLKRTVEFRAAQRNLPAAFTKAALQFAVWRNGIDWDAMGYLGKDKTDALTAPILLIHGEADRVVSVSTSDTLAKARPDLVTYRRLPGVGHVQGWNADPDGYGEALQAFLSNVLGR